MKIFKNKFVIGALCILLGAAVQFCRAARIV